MFFLKKGGAGSKVVMRISSITAQQGSIMNHYVPGSGIVVLKYYT